MGQISADVLGERICNCLETNKEKNFTDRIVECRQLIRNDLADLSTSKRKKKIEEMDIYLQKNCLEFLKIVTKDNILNKGDWVAVDTNPPTNLEDSVCSELFKKQNIFYIQATSDTISVVINDNYWIETSGLNKYKSIEKIDFFKNCEFTLEFVESNDPTANKYSKQGDKIYYRILDQTNSYFSVSATRNGITLLFKIYYKNN